MESIARLEHSLYPFDLENALLDTIAKADKDVAGEYLDLLIEHILKIYNDDTQLELARLYELPVLISRTAVKNGADPKACLALSRTFLLKADKNDSIDAVCYRLAHTMDKYIDELKLPKVKHTNIVNQAVEYIDMHYAEKISLSDIANMVYISAPYFSKIFKQELGISFNNYLNKVRIDQSKQLLRNNALKLVDIALMVGFDSQSYFTKVFKKMVGVPPLRYRSHYYK